MKHATKTGYMTMAMFCAELSNRAYPESPMPPALDAKSTIDYTPQVIKWVNEKYPHMNLSSISKNNGDVNRLYEMCMFPVIFKDGNKFKYPHTDIVTFEMLKADWDEEVVTVKMHGGENDGKQSDAPFDNLWYPFKTGEYVLID